MGENTGMIVKIDQDFIYLRQVIFRHPDWKPTDEPPFVSHSKWNDYSEGRMEEVDVKFPKHPAAR